MGALSIRNVKKNFAGTDILKGIDIEIEAGQFLILVGPSGCGKSTLLNLICGLEQISSGEISIGDRVVNTIPPKDRDIAMVFQSYALYPNMNVKQNIAFGMQMRNVPKAEQEETIARVAKMLQMEHLLLRKPSQLSGGQRQRVAMGRALARNPKLFLFDEPLSNLDAKLRVEMRTEIKLLHQRTRTTTVYVTHDQIEAMTLGDRIAVMKDGIVQQFGSPYEIYNNPANLFVAGFIGSPSMNFIPVQLSISQGQLTVALTTEEGEFQLPVTDNGDLAAYAGRPLVLGLRPEHLTVAGNENLPSLRTRVLVTEPTGPDTLIFTTINGAKTVCRVAPTDAQLPGHAMTIQVDMAKAVFFDPESEHRVR